MHTDVQPSSKLEQPGCMQVLQKPVMLVLRARQLACGLRESVGVTQHLRSQKEVEAGGNETGKVSPIPELGWKR